MLHPEKRLAELFRSVRRSKNISVDRLCKAANVSKTTVWRIENARFKFVKDQDFKRIARALEMPLNVG